MAPENTDLSSVTSVRPLGGGRFELVVPEGWGMLRSTFGGLVLGALTRAMEEALAMPGWSLRSLIGQLPAPVVPGPVEIHVEELRRGSGTANLFARLFQSGKPVATASGFFGKARPRGSEIVALPPPPPVAPEDIPPLPADAMGKLGAPEFTQFMEYRAVKHFPFSGGTEAAAEGFIRPRKASRGIGIPELVALADAWWLSVAVPERSVTPLATVAFSFEPCLPLPELSPERPLFHRGRTARSAEGFCVEFRELWDKDRLVALNQQTIAII